MALKFKENWSEINLKMGEYKGKRKKKLFSTFKVYDHDKATHSYMMHTYKRHLTPIKENF